MKKTFWSRAENFFSSEICVFFSDVKKPAKSARPGLGRFGPQSGPASADLGLSQARPRPDPARPSQADRAWKFFLFFYFLKDYLSLCLPISMHETYWSIYFVLSNN